MSNKDVTRGINSEGFEDPRGVFPKKDYYNSASTNKASRGLDRNELYNGGGHKHASLELNEQGPSQYPYNLVQQTVSGHSIEYDDTPGSERILIKHRTGAGIECRSDGTVLIASRKNTVRVSGGDERVIIEGDGKIIYEGNLDLHVAGDYTVNVGGNYNTVVQGDTKHVNNSHYNNLIQKNKIEKVVGSTTRYTTNETHTVFGQLNTAVSGQLYTQASTGKLFFDDSALFTAGTDFTLTSLQTNINGSKLALLGDSGTIGGANITNYAKNIFATSSTYTEGVTAPTFHGSLEGNALTANQAGSAGTAGAIGSGGSAGSHTNTATNTAQTVQPTTSIITDLVDNSSIARRRVFTDPGNVLKNSIDLTEEQGIAARSLTTEQVRSKRRDQNNIDNPKFTASQLAANKISPNAFNTLPSNLVRSVGKEPSVHFGSTPIGEADNAFTKKFVVVPKQNTRFVPDAKYNMSQLNTAILPSTLLGPELPLARFFGGFGDQGIFNTLTEEKKKIVARNLMPQAEIIRLVRENETEFRNHRLVVAEGFYTPDDNENLVSGSINDLATNGQVVVYELYDENGNIDHEKTFDLAVHIHDYAIFQKMILDYDTLNPDGSLNTQIVMIMPNLDKDLKGNFAKDVETQFNNNVQASDELVEIKI